MVTFSSEQKIRRRSLINLYETLSTDCNITQHYYCTQLIELHTCVNNCGFIKLSTIRQTWNIKIRGSNRALLCLSQVFHVQFIRRKEYRYNKGTKKVSETKGHKYVYYDDECWRGYDHWHVDCGIKVPSVSVLCFGEQGYVLRNISVF